MTEPVTFVEKSYVLFDTEANAVLTTNHGNLAVFSTRRMAELWASKSTRSIEVRSVYIRPAAETRQLNDAPVLNQLEGQYEKFLMMVLHKYLPDGVIITTKDIEKILEEQKFDPWVLFSHGHKDSFEFKAIRESEAQLIVDHDQATNRGRA